VAAPVALGRGAALSVDVEEWYHNCWVPEYVDPVRRGPLVEELDRLLPATLDRFARLGLRATFFVLGEVARRLPRAIREVARAGHEVACHGDLHLRANDRSPAEFRRDIERAKLVLEDLLGEAVVGFRAPEWSLRRADNPRLRLVAETGFRYDSSLIPAAGAGGRGNPTRPVRLVWPDGVDLLEIPPLVWGGPLRLPAGGWCGRVASPGWIAAAAARAAAREELPLLVVHPWELVDRPCPGLLTGFARFFHEAGREGFAARFDRQAAGLELSATLAGRCAARAAGARRREARPALAAPAGFGAQPAESAP
jgi:peptidoglycan/xylan/chitin deacetylase (PgdA/CDA1 family)